MVSPSITDISEIPQTQMSAWQTVEFVHWNGALSFVLLSKHTWQATCLPAWQRKILLVENCRNRTVAIANTLCY